MNTQINITENGTATLATAGKYCDRNIDVNVNVPTGGGALMEVHRITIAEDLTSGYYTILENSDFVKEHGNKDGFVISLTALTPAVVGTPAVGFGYACNRVLVQEGTSNYSVLSFYTTASGRNVKTHNTKANATVYNLGVPFATGGNVRVNPSATYPLLAGDYLLMMAVVEG